MKEVEQEGNYAANPDAVHTRWLVEGSESSALQHANKVCGQDVRDDAFYSKRLRESWYAGHFEQEEDAEFAVDGVAVCSELVCPTEESGCAARCLRVGEGGDEVGGVAGETGNVKDGAEDCCDEGEIGGMDERRGVVKDDGQGTKALGYCCAQDFETSLNIGP